jgi:exodeoxyribonuclease VII small subunit
MSEITFEEAMSKIQDIVSRLEKGEVKLQEATALFEEGLELLNFCEKQLSGFSDKVEALKIKNLESQHEA